MFFNFFAALGFRSFSGQFFFNDRPMVFYLVHVGGHHGDWFPICGSFGLPQLVRSVFFHFLATLGFRIVSGQSFFIFCTPLTPAAFHVTVYSFFSPLRASTTSQVSILSFFRCFGLL